MLKTIDQVSPQRELAELVHAVDLEFRADNEFKLLSLDHQRHPSLMAIETRLWRGAYA